MRFSLVLIAAMVAGPARADDLGPCDKILEYVVRSYVSEATRKDFGRGSRVQAYQTLCSEFQKASKDASQARRMYQTVGGEGAYEKSKFDKLKKAYCTLDKNITSDQAVYRKTAAALKPKGLTEWQRCTEAEKGKYGPPMEVEQIDDFIVSFTLKPQDRELRSVRVDLQGFSKCSGFVERHDLGNPASHFEIPVLPKNAEADLACFRQAKKVPCETESAVPASLKLEFEDGGKKIKHEFDMVRVMSTECPLPQAQ
jgi:hypothetical protein